MEDITLNVLEDCLYQSSERAILLQFAFQLTSVTQFIIPSLKAKYLLYPPLSNLLRFVRTFTKALSEIFITLNGFND